MTQYELIEAMARAMKPEAFRSPDYVGGETLNIARQQKWLRRAEDCLAALDAEGYAVVPKEPTVTTSEIEK